MESAFRAKIRAHIDGLPQADSLFRSFSTNPFVLMFYALQNNYTQVARVAQDLSFCKGLLIDGDIGREDDRDRDTPSLWVGGC